MYSRLLNSYPLPTKCVTSGLIFSAGDIITQKGQYFVIQSFKKRATLMYVETSILPSQVLYS